MKIRRLLVKDLNRHISGEIRFFDSLNILTGPNGSGKTTLLKACWYLYSGNLKNAFLEIEFTKIELETDRFNICLECSDLESSDPTYTISMQVLTELPVAPKELIASVKEPVVGTWSQIKDAIWKFSILLGVNHDSLFFPTFRRVEGGYSMEKVPSRANRQRSGGLIGAEAQTEDELTKALQATSRALTAIDNKFVCSMSVADVEKLVSDARAKMDFKQTQEYESLAGRISKEIRKWQTTGESADTSAEYLRRILGDVSDVENTRDKIVEPMQLLNREIAHYFPNRSIKLGRQTLLENKNEIDASALSAGEKQLLSFLCYAALNKDYVFMVDEPELSLHLDWQRKLISSLTTLGPTHQYFFVTHSPAIYTKFSDCEIPVDQYMQ